MKRSFLPRYFLASIALLLIRVALHTARAARRTQRELLAQMGEKGLPLAHAREASSRGAIRGNALMEEMLGRVVPRRGCRDASAISSIRALPPDTVPAE